VPRAFEENGLTDEQRREVVALLAQRRGELEDVPHAQAVLSGVALVESTQATWELPGDAYLDDQLVRWVLGSGRALAVVPAEHHLAVEELLVWLGAAREPRAADVVERVRQLSQQGVTDPHKKIVERILTWLGPRWLTLSEGERDEFVELCDLRWLPQRDSNAWHAPEQLDLVFREYLYESQGRFLDLPRRVQERGVDLLRWLGLSDDPTPEQVADHLRHCATTGQTPNREIYGFLNQHASNVAVQRLRDVACLHIDGKWWKPSEVFWSAHPFGEWRVRLGHDFARYQELFDELGVDAEPSSPDAIAVLRDISAKYSPANLDLPDEDRAVVLECWRLCDAALHAETLDAAELAALGRDKVIADDRGILMKPSLLFFEDLPALAEELPGIKTHVIRRPDGAWRAMQAAGVRDLSKVAVARVVDVGDRLEADELKARLKEREVELARVISPVTLISWRDLAQRMNAIEWLIVGSMSVVWELEEFGQRFTGEAKPADALWQSSEEVLYVAVEDGAPVWEAIARELVRALLEIEPATLALGIAAALGQPTRDAAKRALDAAGYPQLAPEVQAEISSTIASDLDAEEIDTEGEPLAGAEGGEEVIEDDEADADLSPTPGDEPEAEEQEDEEDLVHVPGSNGAGPEGTGEGAGAGPGGQGTPGTGGAGGGGKPRSRLRSYVVRGDKLTEDSDGEALDRSPVDAAGVEAVRLYEISQGRVPQVQAHNNPGFDVLSEYADGEIARYIEVKSSEGPWDSLGVGLSDTQFTTAQRIEDEFWLYVVEYACDPDRCRIWPVQDPARQVTEFMYDDGWKDAADPDGGHLAAESALPDVDTAGTAG